jgi:membrane-bound lytic murein transglycosylase D
MAVSVDYGVCAVPNYPQTLSNNGVTDIVNVRRLRSLLVLLFVLAITPACQTGPQTETFDPVDTPAIAGADLEPVEPRSNTELLAAADEAFRRGNKAQEIGNHEEALRQYNLMLELMIEADVDPELFYNFRQEFARMFDSVADDPAFFDRSQDDEWIAEAKSRGWTGTLPMAAVAPKRYAVELDKIKKVYPKNFQGGLDRSGLYRPYIEQVFAKEGIPSDIIALAMVESQFHPNVRSRAGAVGMWQFMAATGKRYGLRIDQHVDERRDWQKATHAAAQYLRDLNKFFDGDWALAITAYNMGEYGLERAIAANGGERNLAKLLETPPASNMIHRESKEFYAKLLASAVVMRDPERHGFNVKPAAGLEIDRITTKESLSLASIEKTAGLPKDTLKNLNPHLLRGATPPGSYELVVPAGSNRTVVAALRKVPEEEPARPVFAEAPGDGYHVVKRGDTLSGIASMYRVALAELRNVNDNIAPNRLMVGHKLRIPGEGKPFAGEQKMYRVRRGDTLYEIAKREGVTIANLRDWNDLGRSSDLRIGDELIVGGDKPTTPSGTKQVHKVQPGESAGIIAKKYNIKVDDLLAWNGLTRKSILRVGDSLSVYGSSGAAAATVVAKNEKVVHKVRKGETASKIASQYGVNLSDLFAWNQINQSSVLHIGRELTVYTGESNAYAQQIAESTEPAPIIHVVERGQNPTTIAAKYGVTTQDIMMWNNWTGSHVLHIGDKVTIYAQ